MHVKSYEARNHTQYRVQSFSLTDPCVCWQVHERSAAACCELLGQDELLPD